jgi:hypothetical protein
VQAWDTDGLVFYPAGNAISVYGATSANHGKSLSIAHPLFNLPNLTFRISTGLYNISIDGFPAGMFDGYAPAFRAQTLLVGTMLPITTHHLITTHSSMLAD